MTPAWAAPICGLAEEDIVGSARLYASGNNAAIQWGLAFDQQVSAMALNLAVCDLMAICGNIDRPGGNILVRNSFEINAGYASGEDFTPQSAKDRKLAIARGLGISGGEFIAHAATDGILHCIEAGELPNGDAYPIKMIWFRKLQLARLRQAWTRRATTAGAEDGRLHRERRPRPHAAFGRSRRRAAARGHELRAQLRPHLVDAGAHHVPRRRAGGRGQDRRADSRGPHAAPQPGSRRVVRLDEGHRHRRLVPGRGRRQEARRVVQREGQHFRKGEGRLRHELPRAFRKRGATPTTTGTTPTRNMPRACCAPTGIPGSPLLRAASSWCRMRRSAFGAFRRLPFMWNRFRPKGGLPIRSSRWSILSSSSADPVRSSSSIPSIASWLRCASSIRCRSVMVSPMTAEEYGVSDGEWVWIENTEGRFRQKVVIDPTLAPGFVDAEHGWWFPEEEPAFRHLFRGTVGLQPQQLHRFLRNGGGRHRQSPQ